MQQMLGSSSHINRSDTNHQSQF